jgi:hypothetical protein
LQAFFALVSSPAHPNCTALMVGGYASERANSAYDTLFVPHCRSDTVEVIEVCGVSLDSGDVASDQFGGLVELCLPTAENKDVSAFGDKTAGRSLNRYRSFRR